MIIKKSFFRLSQPQQTTNIRQTLQRVYQDTTKCSQAIPFRRRRSQSRITEPQDLEMLDTASHNHIHYNIIIYLLHYLSQISKSILTRDEHSDTLTNEDLQYAGITPLQAMYTYISVMTCSIQGQVVKLIIMSGKVELNSGLLTPGYTR